MKCLVTGAAGFIGSTLTQRLLAEGHSVIAIDAFTDYYDSSLKRRNIDGVLNQIELVEGNLNDLDLSKLLSRGVDVVFHQAGQPGVRKSWGQEFRIYLDENVHATQKLLEAAAASDVKRIVYASSSSIYGDAILYPTTESDLPQPVSPYGVTKLAAEHLCSLYAKQFGVPTVSLRYFTVYGPKQRPDMAFTKFIKCALADEPLEVYGDGTQIRDFTYVDDAVEANLVAAFAPGVAKGEVMNVAGGTSISVNEVIGLLAEILDKKIEVEYRPTVRGDVFQTGGRADRLRGLGWQPRVAVREGLEAQVEWVRSKLTGARTVAK